MSRTLTRRRVLQAGGVAVAAAAVGGLPALTSGAVALRRSTFTPLVGDRFTLDGVPARLAAVDDYGAGRLRSERGSQAAFVLIFHATRSARRVEQGVVAVRHPDMGSVRMLVTPAGTGRSGQDYTVVIDTRRAARPRP